MARVPIIPRAQWGIQVTTIVDKDGKTTDVKNEPLEKALKILKDHWCSPLQGEIIRLRNLVKDAHMDGWAAGYVGKPDWVECWEKSESFRNLNRESK